MFEKLHLKGFVKRLNSNSEYSKELENEEKIWYFVHLNDKKSIILKKCVDDWIVDKISFSKLLKNKLLLF